MLVCIQTQNLAKKALKFKQNNLLQRKKKNFIDYSFTYL